MHDDRLIIKRDHEGESSIVVLVKSTGEELWRTARDEITSWSPPLVVEHQGQTQVVDAATNKDAQLRFRDRRVNLGSGRFGSQLRLPAPVHQGDTVNLMSGFMAPNLMAIRVDKKGDLTASDAVAWENKQANSYSASPVLHELQLYVLTDSGVLTNFDAATGEVHYRERLPGPSTFKASPVGVSGMLYLASEEGQVFVLTMGPEFQVLATNTIEDARFVTTPAIVDGEIFLRSQDSLYCISTLE